MIWLTPQATPNAASDVISRLPTDHRSSAESGYVHSPAKKRAGDIIDCSSLDLISRLEATGVILCLQCETTSGAGRAPSTDLWSSSVSSPTAVTHIIDGRSVSNTQSLMRSDRVDTERCVVRTPYHTESWQLSRFPILQVLYNTCNTLSQYASRSSFLRRAIG